MNAQAGTLAQQTGPRPAGGSLIWLLLALFVLGVVSLVYGLSSETARPDFGLFTVSFLYLMGMTQAGVVFSSMMRLIGAEWSKPYYRLAELATLAFFPFAVLGFVLIVSFAGEELFYWMSSAPDDHVSPWLDINWLWARNLLGLLLFYSLSAVYVWKGLAPDLAAAGGGAPDHRRAARQLYLLSPFVIIAFVFTNTLVSWDFGMMLIEHWHSTVFPIHFSFGNLFAATAALIALPAVLGRAAVTASPFGPQQIRSLGMLITGFTLLWLYFYWSQFFVIWFGNLPHETEPLWTQMYGHYAPFYWTMMVGCFFLPMAALIFAPIKRSVAALLVIALGINVGIWINKYLTVVPVLSAGHRPFENWLDVALAVGLVAGFLAVLMLLSARLPRYAYWEMNWKEPREIT
jgi:hypothetical protein